MQTINIPQERVPVLLGTKGRDKRRLEKASGAKFEVDSEGEVRITSPDAVKEWRARDIVMAVGRGFSPDRALMLIDEECYLKVIDLRGEFSDKDIERVKGRIIGEKGRTRQIIEDTSDAYICVYGHTVSILGKLDELTLAARAVEKLMDGAMHTTVYKLLDEGRRELKRKRAMLWEEKPLTKI
ncbi:MAG: KH domain-containing protein [Candidatus Micrarchaeia archaeon]|jgi:ribosomal RNA assembly protein